MELKRRKRNVKIIFPSILTSLSMVLGFVAILQAANGNVNKASYFILISIILDGLDGKVARLTNTASEFGIQYDSLADLVAFGVAPAAIYYYFFIHEQGQDPIYFFLPIIFLLCGGIRLARFNVTASVFGKSHFIGLPIPAAACTLVIWPPLCSWAQSSSLLANSNLKQVLTAQGLFIFSVVLSITLSVSMISQIRFDMPGEFWLRKFRIKSLNYLVLVSFLCLNFIHFIVFMTAICCYYILSTLIRALIELLRKHEQLLDNPRAVEDED